jgi:hypothetical protein
MRRRAEGGIVDVSVGFTVGGEGDDELGGACSFSETSGIGADGEDGGEDAATSAELGA